MAANSFDYHHYICRVYTVFSSALPDSEYRLTTPLYLSPAPSPSPVARHPSPVAGTRHRHPYRCHGSALGNDKPPAPTPAATPATTHSTTPATRTTTLATTHVTPTTALLIVAIGRHGLFRDHDRPSHFGPAGREGRELHPFYRLLGSNEADTQRRSGTGPGVGGQYHPLCAHAQGPGQYDYHRVGPSHRGVGGMNRQTRER